MRKTSNKTIASNTLFLYIRMFVVMGIGLYSSRIILDALGFVDYGIFNVVGGIIGLFGFISVSLNTASTRFFNVALGKDDGKELNTLFKASITTHILISILILIACETIGLWLLNEKLNIPIEQRLSAKIVYQIAVFSTIITIIQTPFTALIISHEKMNIYAVVEIFFACIKLIAVLCLPYFPNNRLVVYMLFLTVISVSNFLLYAIICKRQFRHCHIGLIYNKIILIPILSFSGWDLYGNMCVTARAQGVSVLLNIFFGTVINAASGIANQVQFAVSQFSNNVLMAFRPQIMKSYACGDYKHAVSLVVYSAKFTSILLILFCVPLMLNMEFILKVWLGKYPEYTPIFCKWSILFIIVANLSSCVMIFIHATGRIKPSSLFNGSLYLAVLPISYISFKNHLSPTIPFIINTMAVVCGCFMNIIYASRFSKSFHLGHFLSEAVLPIISIAVTNYFCCTLVRGYITDQLLRLFIMIMVSLVLSGLSAFVLLLNSTQRKVILSIFGHHESK